MDKLASTLFIIFLCFCDEMRCNMLDFRYEEITADDTVLTYNNCTEPWCERYSASEVKKRFLGVFLTNDYYIDQQKIIQKKRSEILRDEGVKDVNYIVGLTGDGDSCCVTTFDVMINTTMVNIYGEERYIVHMGGADPPSYQFIRHAYCVKVGSCDGL